MIALYTDLTEQRFHTFGWEYAGLDQAFPWAPSSLNVAAECRKSFVSQKSVLQNLQKHLLYLTSRVNIRWNPQKHKTELQKWFILFFTLPVFLRLSFT